MGEPTMIWNDPDPIEGNDYRVFYYQPYDDNDTALIHYGGGSEAQVFVRELQDLDLQYHTSWDWLMPVVDKCTQIGFIDTDSDDNPMYELWERLFCDNIGQFLGNHIDEVYNSVVEFIKTRTYEKENSVAR